MTEEFMTRSKIVYIFCIIDLDFKLTIILITI